MGSKLFAAQHSCLARGCFSRSWGHLQIEETTSSLAGEPLPSRPAPGNRSSCRGRAGESIGQACGAQADGACLGPSLSQGKLGTLAFGRNERWPNKASWGLGHCLLSFFTSSCLLIWPPSCLCKHSPHWRNVIIPKTKFTKQNKIMQANTQTHTKKNQLSIIPALDFIGPCGNS